MKLHNRNRELDDLYDEYELDDEPQRNPVKPIQPVKAEKKSQFKKRQDDDFEDDYDDFDDDYYDEEDDYYEEPKRKSFRREKEKEEDTTARFATTKESKSAVKSNSKVTPMRQVKKNQGGNAAMEVCVIKPTSVEDAREITETLLNNRTVVLNLEGLDLEIGQRIIDFTSGSCFAIDGNLQKISNFIFIVTPAAVDISGDFQSIMDAFDVSSLQNDI